MDPSRYGSEFPGDDQRYASVDPGQRRRELFARIYKQHHPYSDGPPTVASDRAFPTTDQKEWEELHDEATSPARQKELLLKFQRIQDANAERDRYEQLQGLGPERVRQQLERDVEGAVISGEEDSADEAHVQPARLRSQARGAGDTRYGSDGPDTYLESTARRSTRRPSNAQGGAGASRAFPASRRAGSPTSGAGAMSDLGALFSRTHLRSDATAPTRKELRPRETMGTARPDASNPSHPRTRRDPTSRGLRPDLDPLSSGFRPYIEHDPNESVQPMSSAIPKVQIGGAHMGERFLPKERRSSMSSPYGQTMQPGGARSNAPPTSKHRFWATQAAAAAQSYSAGPMNPSIPIARPGSAMSGGVSAPPPRVMSMPSAPTASFAPTMGPGFTPVPSSMPFTGPPRPMSAMTGAGYVPPPPGSTYGLQQMSTSTVPPMPMPPQMTPGYYPTTGGTPNSRPPSAMRGGGGHGPPLMPYQGPPTGPYMPYMQSPPNTGPSYAGMPVSRPGSTMQGAPFMPPPPSGYGGYSGPC